MHLHLHRCPVYLADIVGMSFYMIPIAPGSNFSICIYFPQAYATSTVLFPKFQIPSIEALGTRTLTKSLLDILSHFETK